MEMYRDSILGPSMQENRKKKNCAETKSSFQKFIIEDEK